LENKCLFIHLTLVPYLAASGELKTKPTQHSVKKLLEDGIQPDILVLRTEKPLSDDLRRKVGLFCNVDRESVVQSIDVSTIYEVPLVMQEEKLDVTILKKFGLEIGKEPELGPWKEFVDKIKNPAQKVKIVLVGKYVELPDAYKSIVEAFIHAGAVNNCKVELSTVHSEEIEQGNIDELLSGYAGILVAPGFGHRGIEGKIQAVKYAREKQIPFLGICLGMQCAVIEFARNVLNISDANSREMHPQTKNAVIDIMEEQKEITEKGGTMRLGAYPCKLRKGSKSYKAYGKEDITERHRHRYEFNNEYLEQYENAGMKAAGINPSTNLVEIVEIPKHPWFVGVQYHPEYKSTVLRPHPLFVGFVKAAIENQK
jgi:CTP synthase